MKIFKISELSLIHCLGTRTNQALKVILPQVEQSQENFNMKIPKNVNPTQLNDNDVKNIKNKFLK